MLHALFIVQRLHGIVGMGDRVVRAPAGEQEAGSMQEKDGQMKQINL